MVRLKAGVLERNCVQSLVTPKYDVTANILGYGGTFAATTKSLHKESQVLRQAKADLTCNCTTTQKLVVCTK